MPLPSKLETANLICFLYFRQAVNTHLQKLSWIMHFISISLANFPQQKTTLRKEEKRFFPSGFWKPQTFLLCLAKGSNVGSTGRKFW